MEKANVNHTYEASSLWIKALDYTKADKDKKEQIKEHLKNEIMSLREDLDIQPGDEYQIVIRKRLP